MRILGYSKVNSLCALLIGFLLMIWPDIAVIYLVMTIGVLFLLPGVYGIFLFFTRSPIEGKVFPIIALGSTLLGIWLVIMPNFFVNILMYVLGGLLVLGGAIQLMNFISTQKECDKIPVVLYVIPTLILLSGILIVFNPFEAATVPFIVLGVSSFIYGLTDLFRIIRHNKHKKIDKII